MNFGGHSEDGIDIDRHRQRIAVAVVNVAAARLHGNTTVLLTGRALHEVAILDDLQTHQAETDDEDPNEQNGSEDVEPFAWCFRSARPHTLVTPFYRVSAQVSR